MYQYATATSIRRLSDMALIPIDQLNPDYVEVMAWVAQGNTVAPIAVDTDKEREERVTRAWVTADQLANTTPEGKRWDENCSRSLNGLTAQAAAGLLPAAQAARIMAWLAWWSALWAQYRAVAERIRAGDASAAFDAVAAGPMPYDIWQISSSAEDVA